MYPGFALAAEDADDLDDAIGETRRTEFSQLSASFIIYFKRGDPINFLLSGTTTLLGNVFFPVEQLPAWARWVSDYLPITWSLRVVRGALLQGKGWDELERDVGFLALLTLILVPLGLFCSRIAIRRAKREGSLIQY